MAIVEFQFQFCFLFFGVVFFDDTHIVPIPPDAFVSGVMLLICGVMLLIFALIDILHTLHNTLSVAKQNYVHITEVRFLPFFQYYFVFFTSCHYSSFFIYSELRHAVMSGKLHQRLICCNSEELLALNHE